MMTDKPQPLAPRQRTASRTLLALDAIGLLLLLYCFTRVAGKFREIFHDLLDDQGMPALTHWFISIPPALSLAVIVGAIGALIYKEGRNNDRRNVIINATTLAVIVIVFMIFVVAMFRPMVVIVTTLKK
jgi:hypothetical protein